MVTVWWFKEQFFNWFTLIVFFKTILLSKRFHRLCKWIFVQKVE
ncbi:conserved hypothetical protein [Vibrio cholerae RC385]|nr:conserved hypothetical protein [Vibrio cholerae RC385]